MTEKQIFSAIFILKPDLSVARMQRRRNPRYYGEVALIDKINCWI